MKPNTNIYSILSGNSIDRLGTLTNEQRSLVHAYEIMRQVRRFYLKGESKAAYRGHNLAHGAMVYLRNRGEFPQGWE